MRRLIVKSLGIGYAQHVVLEDASLTVGPGSISGLLGPKETLKKTF